MNAHVIAVDVEELDVSTTATLVRLLDDVQPTDHVVVDFRRVRFCDSSGIGALVTAWRDHDAAGGSLRLINVTEHVTRTLQIIGLEPFLLRAHGAP